jgi:hypothetical protein
MRPPALDVATMARGKKCPECGSYMYADKEDDQAEGRYVTYVCPNNECKFTEKVFEKYLDRK